MKFYIKDKEGNETELESLYLDIKDNDVILFKVPNNITTDAKIHIKETLQSVFPNNKIAIINDDIDIGVIRNE